MRKFVLAVLLFVLPAFAEETRHFQFHYSFTVRNVEAGQKAEIWIPEAHSDEFQEVRVLSAGGDVPLTETRELTHGNRMYHAIVVKATKPEYSFEIVYDVIRHERIGLPREGMQPHILRASQADVQRSVGPNKLVPVTGRLAGIAEAQVKGQSTTLEKARALYDYVFGTMRYDKSGTGWGRGDAEWACDSKRGNCTDFHSVFLSMARSQGIPARFDIGFPIPADKQSGEVAGYHCWAEFYDAQYGWVPVDISEAWKHPIQKNYFFGANDANRVQFTSGRDLVLSPQQSGGPLNYFVYPYVEVNGKSWENVSNRFLFQEDRARATSGR